MVNLSAAARTQSFDEKTLRLTLAETARLSYGDGTTVKEALKQGITHSMADDIISPDEEERPRNSTTRWP